MVALATDPVTGEVSPGERYVAINDHMIVVAAAPIAENVMPSVVNVNAYAAPTSIDGRLVPSGTRALTLRNVGARKTIESELPSMNTKSCHIIKTTYSMERKYSL